MNLQANDAVAAMAELVEMGFTHDFRIRDGALINISADRPVDPASVEVVAKYRFETAPESGDESNIYALNVGNGQAKGFLIDALALEGDGAPQDLIARLNAADSTTQTEHSAAMASARFAGLNSPQSPTAMSCELVIPISPNARSDRASPCWVSIRHNRNMSGW